MSETTFTPGPDSLRAYRDALGCFGTGVTVVTTVTDRGPLAITANSFTSVSMDPPLLLWCPARQSKRHDPFVQAGHFSIHVMAEEQLDLAMHFARNGEDFSIVADQRTDHGIPVLPGTVARFDCRHHACHDGGDHSILVGHVEAVTARPGMGLIFKRGQYGGFLEK
ncbi:flavin reductase family protein [Phaeobacter italicus]|uniref:flavin reductase family protein n=1 Tax=Phaeobacter italicus TaxID=481446 RepID=UPI000187068B|nr:flavin reductase family protein [Phaeobacter italicus]EEB70011.1 flavin reductase domain protein [Ruegeria sp. R11]CRL14033.1 FMN reductase (NADH) NtaB [Phaeobacter italicus]SFG14174.1 NADH-FMN oxidoreductase RutF, flavin reductase (DIM6/NTAB) family [Phaeobacter italicus]